MNEEKEKAGTWRGSHWISRGYCKACDGKCENVTRRNDGRPVAKQELEEV